MRHLSLALVLALAAPSLAQDRAQFLVGFTLHHDPAAGFRVPAPAHWKRVAQDRFDLVVEATGGSTAFLAVLQRFVDGGVDELERRVRAENPLHTFTVRELDGKAGRFRHLHGVSRGTGPKQDLHVGLFARGRRGFEVVVKAASSEADALRRTASNVLRGFEIVPMGAAAPRLGPEGTYPGFLVRAPAGWERRLVDGGMVAALEGRGVLALFSVQREPIPGPYEKVYASERAELAREKKLTDDPPLESGGRSTKLVRFESDTPVGEGKRRTITLWTMLGRPGVYVHVYYTAEPEVFEVYKPAALAALRSIRIP